MSEPAQNRHRTFTFSFVGSRGRRGPHRRPSFPGNRRPPTQACARLVPGLRAASPEPGVPGPRAPVNNQVRASFRGWVGICSSGAGRWHTALPLAEAFGFPRPGARGSLRRNSAPMIGGVPLVEIRCAPPALSRSCLERAGPPSFSQQRIEVFPAPRERPPEARGRPVDATLTDIEPAEQLALGAHFDLEILLADRDRSRNHASDFMTPPGHWGAVFKSALASPPPTGPGDRKYLQRQSICSRGVRAFRRSCPLIFGRRVTAARTPYKALGRCRGERRTTPTARRSCPFG